MEGGLSREASEGAKRNENNIASGWMNLMYILYIEPRQIHILLSLYIYIYVVFVVYI